jgi:threonine synthase
MTSLLSHLACGRCGTQHGSTTVQRTCRECGRPLLSRYALPEKGRIDPRVVAGRPPALRRLQELSPVIRVDLPDLAPSPPVSLAAQGLGVELDMPGLVLIDASRTANATLADRTAAEAVGRARELGVGRLAVASTGPLGLAVASAAALHGLDARVHLPVGSPLADACRARGAQVVEEGRTLEEAAATIHEAAGWLDLTPGREPYGLEGTRTVGFEALLAMGRLPAALVVPADELGTALALWKAWNEAEDLGWIGPGRPKMFLVEHARCAPLSRAVGKKWEEPRPWAKDPRGVPASMRVGSTALGGLLLRVLKVSEGTVVTVGDDELRDAAAVAARRLGLGLGAQGAAVIGASRKLRLNGTLDRSAFVGALLTAGTAADPIDP